MTYIAIITSILLLTSLALVRLSSATENPEDELETISGMGTFTSIIETAEVTPFDPPNECVFVLVRSGTHDWDGFIESEHANSRLLTNPSVVETCVEGHTQLSFSFTTIFEEVTIAGRTGGAVMEAHGRCEAGPERTGVFTCQATLRLVDGTGELEDITGEGVAVITVPDVGANALGFYYFQVQFGSNDDDSS